MESFPLVIKQHTLHEIMLTHYDLDWIYVLHIFDWLGFTLNLNQTVKIKQNKISYKNIKHTSFCFISFVY